MICYVCSNYANHRIYKDLKPVCDVHMVEAVNEEKGDILVTDIPDGLSTINNQIDGIMDIMRKLDDIKKGKLKYGLSDLSDWLETDLERVCTMLDELRNDLEGE